MNALLKKSNKEIKKIKDKVLKRTISVEVPTLQKENRNKRRIGRILAVQALYAFESQVLVNEIICVEELCLFDWEKKVKSSSRDFARQLVKGAIAHLKEIDEMIKPKLVDWEFDRISLTNKSILRLAIYQLLYEKTIPEVVVINEAVDLTKMFSEKEDYKFVNALLDKVKMEFPMN